VPLDEFLAIDVAVHVCGFVCCGLWVANILVVGLRYLTRRIVPRKHGASKHLTERK
jgi:hypothetical protein